MAIKWIYKKKAYVLYLNPARKNVNKFADIEIHIKITFFLPLAFLDFLLEFLG